MEWDSLIIIEIDYDILFILNCTTNGQVIEDFFWNLLYVMFNTFMDCFLNLSIFLSKVYLIWLSILVFTELVVLVESKLWELSS